MDYLTFLGHLPYYAPNRGVPVTRGGKVVWIRGKVSAGVPDVCAIHRDTGKHIGCEIKIGRDKLRPEQERFRDGALKRGAIWIEVRDTTQVLIEAHRSGMI
jgi:hypothetical protein